MEFVQRTHTPLIYCWLCLASRASGAIVFSRAAHPTAKVSTPIAGEFPSVQLKIKIDSLFELQIVASN